MGRLPFGELPGDVDHSSQGIYRFAPRNRKKVIVRPSRRRPEGLYSILGVTSLASPLEITKAYRRLSVQLHPDKTCTDRSSPQERSAATKKFQELVCAKEILEDAEQRRKYDEEHSLVSRVEDEKSTPRVQRLRAQLTRDERRIVGAINTARERLLNAPLPRRHRIECAQGSTFRRQERVHCNNQVTRSPWRVFQRGKKGLRENKRVGKFFVRVQEEGGGS